jgi:tetratricopeptide (TPR) repeat protein
MRALFAGVVCAAVGFFAYQVVRVAWVTRQLESFAQGSVTAALAVDPSNSALHNRAGVLYLNGEAMQPEKAAQELRQAVTLNPHVAEYWINLGRACFLANELDCAGDAYEHSVALAPLTPRVLHEATVYYVASANPAQALHSLHRLLGIDPASAGPALSMCLHAFSPERLWSVIRDQPNTSVKFEFFQILSAQGMDQAAQQFWREFIAARPSISLDDAKPYLSLLEQQQNFPSLVRVWQGLDAIHTAGMPVRAENNLVVNARFLQPPANAGLDWHVRPEQFLNTDVAETERGNALELEFTVADNAEHEPAYQFVPVEPGRSYEVRALARSEEITSDSGPRLRVVDPACAGCVDASSSSTTGSTGWHDIATVFTAGPATQIVRLSVWRARSRSFPTEIRGRFWLNDVSIRATDQ